MYVQRSQTFSASKPKKTILITRIWANDGWCYVPELQQRHKFFNIDEHVMKIESESYSGSIPFPEHSELVTYLLLSEKPLRWAEQGAGWFEVFEEVPAIQPSCNRMQPQGRSV
jgi:hypothetical protein